jgi:hypothetical protein
MDHRQPGGHGEAFKRCDMIPIGERHVMLEPAVDHSGENLVRSARTAQRRMFR